MIYSVPFKYRALGDTEKPTNSTISSGWAGRPIGIPPRASITLWVACSMVTFELSAIHSIIAFEEVVLIHPGDTLRTRTSFGETSFHTPLL